MVGYAQDPGSIFDLGAKFRRGDDTPVNLIQRLFRRMQESEPYVKAWLQPDEEGALEQAARCTREIEAGEDRGPLHGIPVAIKDIVDLAGLPTRANSPSRQFIAPASIDANIVSDLRAAGAIVMGKVHTTEYAYFSGPPPTRNPWDLKRTPGGSSAGSAASVASGTVVCSIGTQTAASVIRPAAYCGIAAFKPTSQSSSMQGIVPLAPSFDTPGWFGYRVADVAALWEAMGAAVPIPARPIHSFTVGYMDDKEIAGSASPAVNQHFAKVCDALRSRGFKLAPQPSPVALSQLNDWHKIVFEYELARSHGDLLASAEGQVEQAFLAAIERGMGISAQHYLEIKGRIHQARLQCWRAWSACDVLMVPATPDIAPIGMATGDARYISPFTALGGPLVAMPTGFGDHHVPLGTMLCAKPYEDNHLLACALSLATAVELARDGGGAPSF